MEADGIIHKEVFAEVPPHVEYSLTKKGQTLSLIIRDMREWGEKAKAREANVQEVVEV